MWNGSVRKKVTACCLSSLQGEWQNGWGSKKSLQEHIWPDRVACLYHTNKCWIRVRMRNIWEGSKIDRFNFILYHWKRCIFILENLSNAIIVNWKGHSLTTTAIIETRNISHTAQARSWCTLLWMYVRSWIEVWWDKIWNSPRCYYCQILVNNMFTF